LGRFSIFRRTRPHAVSRRRTRNRLPSANSVKSWVRFLAAYSLARRLKTLNGLTPYEYISKIWTSEPDRIILDPIHQMPGLNT
jgi:hypothetical protein